MSRTRPAPTRSLRPLRLLLVVLAVAATGCGRQTIPTKYGSTTQKNFVRGCTAEQKSSKDGGSDVAAATQARCTCIYAGLVKTVPFRDFKKINDDQSKAPKPLPDRVLRLRDACARNTRAYTLPANG